MLIIQFFNTKFYDINPIQDGLFWGCSRMGSGAKRPSPPYDLPQISCSDETLHSYTLPKEDPKTIWITWHTPSVLLISAFLLEIRKFCYIKKYRYRFHLDTQFLNLLTFLQSLWIVLIKMVTILMMSAKMVTQAFLK